MNKRNLAEGGCERAQSVPQMPRVKGIGRKRKRHRNPPAPAPRMQKARPKPKATKRAGPEDKWMRELVLDVVDNAVDLQRDVNAQFLEDAEAAAARGAEIWLRPAEEEEDARREYELAVALMKACITPRYLPYAHGPSKKYLCGSCGSLVVDCTCFERCRCTGTILKWSWQRGDLEITQYGPYCECRNRQPQRDWFKFDS